MSASVLRVIQRDLSKSSSATRLATLLTKPEVSSNTCELFAAYRDSVYNYQKLLDDYRVGSSGDSMERVKKTAAMCGLEVTRNTNF